MPSPYGQADNPVALPEQWVRQVQAAELQHVYRTGTAFDRYREASAMARDRL